jgi:heat shock protein HslJ
MNTELNWKKKKIIVGAIVLFVGTMFVFVFYDDVPQTSVPIPDSVSTTTVEQATTTEVVSVEEFETEIKTVLMALDMKPWKWLSATSADGTVVAPKNAEAFLVRFNASGGFSAETDCNSISGSYEARRGSLSLGSIASTKMFCEDSQESEFTELLSIVVTYQFVDNGQLVMTTSEGTEMKFR